MMGVLYRIATMPQTEVNLLCLDYDESVYIVEDSLSWLFQMFSAAAEEPEPTGSLDHFLPVNTYGSNESQENTSSNLDYL